MLVNTIETLWNEIENNLWMLCDIGPAARELGYSNTEYDSQFTGHTSFESVLKTKRILTGCVTEHSRS